MKWPQSFYSIINLGGIGRGGINRELWAARAVLHISVLPNFISAPSLCGQSLVDVIDVPFLPWINFLMTFPKGQKVNFSLSPSVCLHAWLWRHLQSRTSPNPSVPIKSITCCPWHIWPPGGVVAWKSSAVDIPYMRSPSIIVLLLTSKFSLASQDSNSWEGKTETFFKKRCSL